MPIKECGDTGMWRIGEGKCEYDSKEKAERAYRGYLGSKNIEKDQPSSSSVHVPTPLGSKKEKITIKSKSGTTIIIDGDIENDAEAEPPLNNIGKSINGENEEGSALYDMQQIIEGMDWELAHSTKDIDQAKETAIKVLNDDPYHYKKLKLTPKEDYIDNNGSGLSIDLGSGHAREQGHIGFDTYPYDHGTIIHDLDEGIPLSTGSVKKVRAIDSLHAISQDPKALLSEIHRVLMPGGQFEYQGPEEIYNYPEWHHEYPGLIMTDHEDNVEKSEGAPTFKQKFTRLAVPDPATANVAEPRTGVAQYDMLPADDLLAMDAMGYYWSDATTSGKGNRLHGYASQGALVKSKIKKGGPGSGVDGDNTKLINMPNSDFISVGTRKGVLDNMDYEEKKISMNKITHVGQSKYVPLKLEKMIKNYDEIKHKPIDVLKVGSEYHVIDGHHRFLAHKEMNAEKIPARVRIKAEKTFIGKSKNVRITKADKMRQIVYGVVLAPDEVDFQDDYMTAKDIESSAHDYLIRSRIVGKQHEEKTDADVVESYIAPQDLQFEGQNGPQVVKKGSWVMGVKINDLKMWEKVLNDEITGFSVGGRGERD
jgi:uncharacterized ParB-like nuclease family protein